MVQLALANSRMKDFFDIHRLAETRTFDGETMRLAVAATFTRRDIEIPDKRPLALTSEFADDAQKKILLRRQCGGVGNDSRRRCEVTPS